MLSCISVGISEYEHRNLEPIPCAKCDAKNIYDAFQTAMGAEFNHHLSVCVSNIHSEDFRSLLQVVSDVLTIDPDVSDSILVVYFSGHATSDGKTFELQFPSYTGRRTGTDDIFTVDQFAQVFSKKKTIKLLIILDCCSSGSALPIANNEDNGPEISILTAGGSCEPAFFGETGSNFTTALCKSIYEIHRGGETFSLDALLKKTQSNGYPHAYVNRGAARQVDLLFRNSPSDDGFDKYLPVTFARKIAQSNMLSREAMWYSLSNLSNCQVHDICEMYFDIEDRYGHKLAPEASWLVRRAIGSTLANHISYQPIYDLLHKLLESNYWQEQCIALIGLRYLIRENSDLCKYVLYLVETQKIQRIDAVWLAALYAADSAETDWTIFLNTSLALSAWGMIEICKMYRLFDNGLETYLCLRNHPFYEELVAERCRQEKNGKTKLEECVYSAATRGRLPENTQTKFLLSALYGNWRDQISLNLKPYLEQYGRKRVMEELEHFCCVKNAERKMALFSYFNKEKEYLYFSDSLKWGLNDEHPWVRRTAIEFYRELSLHSDYIDELYFTTHFDNKYPGILDFYLTSSVSLHQDLLKYLNEHAILLRGDILSLKQSFSCE